MSALTDAITAAGPHTVARAIKDDPALYGVAESCAKRDADGLLWGPSVPNALLHNQLTAAKSSAPLGHSQCFRIPRYSHIGALVISLLKPVAPLAVGWLVISVGVNSVKGHAHRAIAHIRKKLDKRTIPPCADLYPSTSVVMEIRVFGVVAPVAHLSPRRVSPGVPHTMDKVASGGFIRVIASAGQRMAGSKVVALYNNTVPARAFAEPSNKSGSRVICSGMNCQSGKDLTRAINKFWHFVTSKVITVRGVWKAAVKPLCRAADPIHTTYILPCIGGVA